MHDSLRPAARRYDRRYASGTAPWDSDEPPPEVRRLADDLPPGRALDLGCGRGRASLYLAQRGWRVDGVDFVPRAVQDAARRARDQGLERRARFVVASVTALPMKIAAYDLALDVGCLHRMPPPSARAYRDALARLLVPGATFVLFAHLCDEQDPSPGPPHWIEEPLVYGLFGAGFVLRAVDHGTTRVGARAPFPSAWFRFERAGGSPTLPRPDAAQPGG